MEFTEEELKELDLYLSSNCHYIPGASPSPGPHPQTLPRDSHLNDDDDDDEGDYEYDAFENHQNWDPEAIYYDLNGNVIYQPSAQKDLSDTMNESLRLKSTITTTPQGASLHAGLGASKVPWEPVDIPICRYYPSCRFGASCRYRHPNTSASS